METIKIDQIKLLELKNIQFELKKITERAQRTSRHYKRRDWWTGNESEQNYSNLKYITTTDEQSLSGMEDNIKSLNKMHIIEVPQKKKDVRKKKYWKKEWKNSFFKFDEKYENKQKIATTVITTKIQEYKWTPSKRER